MSELKRYHCKICDKELISREERQQILRKKEPAKELLEYLNDHKLSIHHIDYKRNIAIRVCQKCHDKLHTTMKKHKYGLNYIIRKNGTLNGPVHAGEYPDHFIE
ncbi:MAG TPA: hypothetical protein VMY59_05305 [Candidatus Thermoplasmatota archaeon]|nr:hypothetical protein [Candidatus Thermoplasmatota archaeon]